MAKIFVLFIVTILETFSWAETLTTDDFQKIRIRAQQEVARFGHDRVIVVYDVDNTLLAMDQDLGSDQWFDWQASLIARNVEKADRVAKDIPALLRIQEKIYALSQTHLTQSELPEVIGSLRQLGVRQLVLSSRGPEMWDSTLRELKRNGLHFGEQKESVVRSYVPYSEIKPDVNCLSREDLSRLKLGPARTVRFGEGVMLSAGQHKGAMLRTLLCGIPHVSAILFVDDKQKHTQNVQEAYSGLPVEVVTFRYSREDTRVQAFHSGAKAKAKADWGKVRDVLSGVFQNL